MPEVKEKTPLELAIERLEGGVGRMLDGQAATNTRLDGIEAKQKEHDDLVAKIRSESGDALKVVSTKVETLEGRLADRTIVPPIPGLDPKKFSLSRAMIAIGTRDFSNAGYEKEVMDEARKRALESGTDSAGGWLVPMQAIPGVIELIRAKSIARMLGVRELGGLTGSPVPISKVTGGATAYAVGENKATTASDQTFGQVELHPHGIAAMTKLSRRLVRMSAPAADGIVEDDLARVLALFEDKMVFIGSGADGQPLGVANHPNVLTSSLASIGTTPYEKMTDFVGKLETANTLTGNLGFALHPTGRQLLAKQLDLNGRPLFFNALESAGVGLKAESLLLGYKWATSTQLAVTDCFFANWLDVILADWGAIELRASAETSDAFEKNQIWIQVLKDIDVAVRHDQSIVYTTTLAA